MKKKTPENITHQDVDRADRTFWDFCVAIFIISRVLSLEMNSIMCFTT